MRTPRLVLLLVLLATGAATSAVAAAQTLCVIVNPASGTTALTRAQVTDIYMGRYRKLPSGQAALPIDVGGSAPTRAAFYRRLVGKELADIGSYWARLVFSGQSSPPFQAPDAAAALDLVATNPNAIAYVDRAAVDRRVRVVLELAP